MCVCVCVCGRSCVALGKKLFSSLAGGHEKHDGLVALEKIKLNPVISHWKDTTE